MNKVLITSQGRTATLSLSQSLDKLGGVRSFHERSAIDGPSFLFRSQSSDNREEILTYLKSEDQFATALNAANYVAVNPYYRFAGDLLRKHFGWKIAHLVRHPKTYLESVYVRNTFTPADKGEYRLPVKEDPFHSQWGSATRFERLCWYYAKTLVYFAKSDINWYKFEEIIADVSALNKMQEDLGLPVFPDDFTLPQTNSRPGYRQRLKYHLGLSIKPKPLNWGQLKEHELKTYHQFFDPLAKHFNYDL